MSKEYSPSIENLSLAISKLRNKDEARIFLRDLLTEQELVEFANRWKTAQLLNENTPYSKIKQKTGLSSTTIARVSKWLSHGEGGYKLILARLAHCEKCATMTSPKRKD